ncbi:MAG: MBL fold metallo-hydrolase [Candidatus Nealsonbacteria bacterium]|nr:MBL fold metallo-hydrolase [Candidatus Nealsonbacteria bacterium]
MAEVKVLIEGYTSADSKDDSEVEKTCATISLVRDGDIVMVVDPGVLETQQILIDKLKKEGLAIDDVNIICITHSHIDHYRNIGMFTKAKTLEFFGLWDKNTVDDWEEQFTKDIRIIKTPGHDSTAITLLVNTKDGKVAICGDVFWKENSPETDPFASDSQKLAESRKLVLENADWIIPGHAGIYKVKK